MKDRYQESLRLIEAKREGNIEKLVQLSFDKLKELKIYYYEWHASAKEAGYKESARVNYLHYLTICDAIDIKNGDEEQAWDYLS